MDFVASSVINTNKEISKATATKQSGNCVRWCTFLTQIVVEENFLGGIQYRDKTTLVSSFKASVWRNQFDAKKKDKLFHSTVKAALSDVSVSFRTALRSNSTLDASGQKT